MKYWPKWLRAIYIIAGSVFVLAILLMLYIFGTGAVIPRLSYSPPPTVHQPTPVGNAEPSNLVVVITAVTGLVTAATGLYGQILAGRKMQMDYELAKRQLEMQAKTKEETTDKKG